MIQVDIFIPSIDATYDFLLDESAYTLKVIEDISVILAKQTGSKMPDDITGFLLYRMDSEKQLDLEKTLGENGISDGVRLMLV